MTGGLRRAKKNEEPVEKSVAPAPTQQPTGIRLCLRTLCQHELEANSSFGYKTSCEHRPSLVMMAQFVCLFHLPESEGC